MAKTNYPKRRGRKVQGPAELAGKRATIATRVRPEIRARLDAMVAASAGRMSLSSAVGICLKRGLDAETANGEHYGSEAAGDLFRLLREAAAFATADEQGRVCGDWVDDPELFDRASRAAAAAFDMLRPPGDLVAPKSNALPRSVLEQFLDEMRSAGAQYRALWGSEHSRASPDRAAALARILSQRVQRVPGKGHLTAALENLRQVFTSMARSRYVEKIRAEEGQDEILSCFLSDHPFPDQFYLGREADDGQFVWTLIEPAQNELYRGREGSRRKKA